MSRFNDAPNTAPLSNRKTTNLAGGDAYEISAKAELVSLISTSFASDDYYRSSGESIDRLRELIDQVPPIFAAKAAVYARTELGMRSITHVMTAEITNRVRGVEWVKDFVAKVVHRPDDITEILAYYMSRFDSGKKIPMGLRRGLAKSFDQFDAYQLAKYRNSSKSVSLVDAVNIVHPVPTAKNANALRELVNDTLRSRTTWESKLSGAGSDKDAKESAWRELLAERKIGYFALLRNLRNISGQAPDLIPKAAEMLTDEKLIRNSLVFPFRFLTALQEIADPTLVSALSRAVDISLGNLPRFENSLVVIDHSGSMQYPLNGNDGVARRDIGDVFAAALFKQSKSDVMAFGTDAGYVRGLNPDDSTLSIADRISWSDYGHGTNFPEIFHTANKPYDRIIIFSDMQSWLGGLTKQSADTYKSRQNADPFIYSFDLSGYGSLQLPAKKTFHIAGFSDQTIGMMERLESDPRRMVSACEEIQFGKE